MTSPTPVVSLQLRDVTQRPDWKRSPRALKAGMISKLLKSGMAADPIASPPLLYITFLSFPSKKPLLITVPWLEIHRAQYSLPLNNTYDWGV